MALSAVERRRGNLPADLTTFVGRRREATDVKLRLSTSRLVTLTGVGGVGKTRLAVRVAWELRRKFRDGVWLVELAGLRDPGLVDQTVAASLGLHDRSVDGSLEWLVEYLAEREMLIVLDNCEHLLDACAALANAVLRACRGLQIVTTSRQALGVDGEGLVPVLPLSVPPSGAPISAEELMRYEAVALFADRATAVHPGFVIDSSNIAAVATVCHSLDGIPLALELAASRLRSLSVNELVVRLDDRYNLLTGGSRAALPRQRTLRSLVDWSFELCSETERLVWARLSAFAGGFDLSAAEAVCSDETVPSDLVWEIVSQLVEKSILVVSDERNAARYLFTETLREYGRERLREAVDGGAAVRARHRDWARQLVRSAEAQWFGADQAAIFKRLRREHANLREALNSCLADPVEAKVGLEMAGGLRFYWLVSGRVNEGRRWLDQLLRVCDDQGPSRVQALCVAGYLATMVSDFARAEDLLDQADRLTTRLGDRFGTALGIQIRALTALFRGDPGRAAPLFEKALASHRDLGDESAAIYDEVELALCVTLLGASESATEILEECLVATEARGEQWLRALTLWALGIERCKRRDYDHAEAAELESLRYRSMLDDRSTMWMNIQVLSWIAAARGDAHRAGRLLGASEALAKSVGLSTKLLRHLRDLEEDHEHLVRGNVSKLQYDQGYDEGRRLAFDEVIELALGDERPTPEPQTGSPALASLDSLTKRESQVADLVSQGMSNKEIATALVISPRTAEAHVENILRKLGLTSRTQMAAWKLHRGDN